MGFQMVYRDEIIKKYEYETRKVSIGGQTYEAWFVKGHSTLDGIVFEWLDMNSYDSWANITNYQLTFFILPKNKKEWQIVKEEDRPEWARRHGEWPGIHNIFLKMEEPKVQKRLLKAAKIKELKQTIKSAQQELESLEK